MTWGEIYTSIETGIERSSGWLAPDGTFYLCGPAEHFEASVYLTQKFFDVDFGDHILTKHGWWRIYIGGYARSTTQGYMTQKQLDTLWDLYNCSEEEGWKAGLFPFIQEAKIWE
jgi:hypothetical protein